MGSVPAFRERIDVVTQSGGARVAWLGICWRVVYAMHMLPHEPESHHVAVENCDALGRCEGKGYLFVSGAQLSKQFMGTWSKWWP